MADQNKITSVFPVPLTCKKQEFAKVMETVKPQFKTVVLLSLFCFSNLVFAVIFSAALL